ncbi:polygalacturonase-like isoform X2 [Mercurialis annua]|nr:polygalacturonase-like isoform X2 [Mercurialis annua]
MDAWEQACRTRGAAKVVIPEGKYLLGVRTEFAGPCQGSMEFSVAGTIQAPENMAGDTWVKFQSVDRFTMSGGGTFDGQGQRASNCTKGSHCPGMVYNLRFNYLTRAVIQDITSLNSKNFHINVLGCNDITLHRLNIVAPATSLNTDRIHVGKSKLVRILDSQIATGDDCISIGDGSQDVNITRVTCGPGHGISIGSLGRYPNEEPVSEIHVTNCTLRNTDNGVRIKSWPGLQSGTANGLFFEDIAMDNVAHPILIDQKYCPYNKCNGKAASRVKISNVRFKNIHGTSSTPIAVQLICSSSLPCERVQLGGITLRYTGGGEAKSECQYVQPKVIGVFNTVGCQY